MVSVVCFQLLCLLNLSASLTDKSSIPETPTGVTAQILNSPHISKVNGVVRRVWKFVLAHALGAFFAFLGLIVRASLKSNCKNFSCCCGLFKCVRDTTADLDDLELTTTATNR